MKSALVLLLAFPAQVEFDATKERARITALEKRVTELEQQAVRGEDMWVEVSPGKFVCRIPAGEPARQYADGRFTFPSAQGGCSEHWRAPISGRR